MGACVCSVMDRSWGGGLLHINVGWRGPRRRERRRQGCTRLAPGPGAGAEHISKREWGVRLIVASVVGWAMYLDCKCGFGGRTATQPAGVDTLAVGALWGFLVTTLTSQARGIVQANVLRGEMGAGASAASVLPSTTLRRPVPPDLAPETLWGPGNVDTDATRYASHSKVLIYGSISGDLGFETNH